MEENKVQTILAQYREYVEPEQLSVLYNLLKNVSDESYEKLLYLPLKSPMVTLMLSIFAGTLGVDRFYLGDIGLGVTKLLLVPLAIIFTLGIGVIWPLLDIYFCYKKAQKKNFESIMCAIHE